MAPELIYMLKVNAGIALFYAFYKLFCCRDTFFQWRRIALLSFLVLSFLYPLMDIQTWVKEQPTINELADYYKLLMTANDTIATPATNNIPTPSLLNILISIYWGGIILLSIRFAIQLFSIFRLALKSKNATVNHVKIRSLDEPANPFSFWQWIFIYLPELNENEKQEILMHEQTHIRQWHSIDVIFSEIVNIVCWMNPFAWLLKAEIRLNLEYLADHRVIESGSDKKHYQYHLLGLANQNKKTGLYNNFNLSHLKNRIMMMNKKRTCTTGHIKYALFAPLTAALLLVSNIETVARTAERLINPTETVNEVVTNFPIIQQEKKGTSTFHVTIVDKEGKALPNVKIQTQLNGKLLNFMTGNDGKAVVKLEMGNLKNAYMHASSSDGRGYYFLLVPGEANVTINIDKEQPAPPTPTPDENGIYTVVEVMPEFPGGMNECLKFISENVKYPAIAHKKGITGRVIVQCTIEKDGTVSNVKVARSVNEELDKEAMRVIETMPKWTPGKMKGEPVRCKYSLPITFNLQ